MCKCVFELWFSHLNLNNVMCSREYEQAIKRVRYFENMRMHTCGISHQNVQRDVYIKIEEEREEKKKLRSNNTYRIHSIYANTLVNITILLLHHEILITKLFHIQDK